MSPDSISQANVIVSAGAWHNRSRNTVEVGVFGLIDDLRQIVYHIIACELLRQFVKRV